LCNDAFTVLLQSGASGVSVIRTIRLVRVARVIKMTRYSSSLRAFYQVRTRLARSAAMRCDECDDWNRGVVQAMVLSAHPLSMLVLLVLIAMVRNVSCASRATLICAE
jgi:hypothetical protein